MTPGDISKLDRDDPLADKCRQFELPGKVIYLDGNSLGPMPRTARDRSLQVMDREWAQDLIRSWNIHNWIDLPTQVGEKIAPLLGADPGQVVCCDSTSVNLFKLLCSAMDMQTGRRLVVSQKDNFPADLYMVQGLASLGSDGLCELVVVEEGDIEHRLDTDVAVLLLTHVNFRTGKLHDMRRLTELAQDKGILVLWDLAHSAGAVPLELDDCNVDFAIGCGYKYLNGGPGAPGFLYVAHRHQQNAKPVLSGWMGHQSPFSFQEDYLPATGMQRFLCGTPPILSMSVLDAALSVFADVDMRTLRAKSVALAELFLDLVKEHACLEALDLISPSNSHERGSQLAFSHTDAYAICQALIEHGVITDFRAPDILRVGFAPLYNSYRNIEKAVQILAQIMESKIYRAEKYRRLNKVT